MTDYKNKVLLTIECKNMKNPRLQRSRFDQTLVSSSWLLQENKQSTVDTDGLVTTISIWGRLFGNRKSEKEINRMIDNMLRRASDYANIEDYSASLSFSKIASNDVGFLNASILTSDD